MRCAGLVVVMLLGCTGQPSLDPPLVPIRNMHQQPRYNPQAASEFFADGRTMRPLVEGTLARESEVDPVVASGWQDGPDAGWVSVVPEVVVTRAGGMAKVLARGQERYGIYCAPCHGLTGHGDGQVAVRAAARGAAVLQPPSLHDDRLRHVPDGQIFATASNGIRNMPAYRHSIAVDDRWAIVSYVRALQISQQGDVAPAQGVAP